MTEQTLYLLTAHIRPVEYDKVENAISEMTINKPVEHDKIWHSTVPDSLDTRHSG